MQLLQRRWVGSRTGLDEGQEEKIPWSYRDSNPEPSSPDRIAIPSTLSRQHPIYSVLNKWHYELFRFGSVKNRRTIIKPVN